MLTIRSNQEQAIQNLNTGSIQPGRPSLAPWVVYGLGSESQTLPGFAAIMTPKGLPVDGVRNFSNGWMAPVINLQPRGPDTAAAGRLARKQPGGFADDPGLGVAASARRCSGPGIRAGETQARAARAIRGGLWHHGQHTKHMRRTTALLTLSIGWLSAAEPEKPKNPAIGNPEAIAAGQKMFAGGCSGCHGMAGEGGRGPKLRNRAVWHTLDDDGIFKVIKRGIPGADMPASNLDDDKVWQLVAFVRSINSPAIDQNVPGNVQAGEAVYWGKGGCSNCHAIRGKGGMLGPDLSNTGAAKPVEQIREDILTPDSDGFQTYRRVTAVARDGRKTEGVLRNLTNYSLQVQDDKGGLHLLDTASLREITLAKKSPMPADYGARLSKDELRDLIAYLASQSMRPSEVKK